MALDTSEIFGHGGHMPSPTRELATERLGRPVTDWITDLRTEGASWQMVVIRLHEQTSLDVSVVTLRNWVLEANAA